MFKQTEGFGKAKKCTPFSEEIVTILSQKDHKRIMNYGKMKYMSDTSKYPDRD